MKKPKTSYLLNVNSMNLLITVKADQFEIWLRGEKGIATLKENMLALIQEQQKYEISGTPNSEYLY